MKARVKNFYVEVEPMTRYEYNAQILKWEVQHLENKKTKGYYCNGNGYKFGIDETNFNKIYTIEDDKEI